VRPLAQLDVRRISTVLLDIDDTLTTEGRLTAAAYAALARLQTAGKRVVPITGRPAGWCDHIARMWPVDAVIGENGAFYFYFSEGCLRRHFRDPANVRADKRARLMQLAQNILSAVPGCALASDQPYRESDLAIDYCEDVPPLGLVAAQRIADLMRQAGLTAKISSIHVNGWFGDYDKLAMTRQLFSEQYGMSLEQLQPEITFVGDSPNDAPMFSFFDNSVGVANVRRFEMDAPPKFVTLNNAGSGFEELVDHLLTAR
jgi:HAD superfamily hydrolase (TIGR01484 family)